AQPHRQPSRDQAEEAIPGAQRPPRHVPAPAAQRRKTASNREAPVPPGQSPSTRDRSEVLPPGSPTWGVSEAAGATTAVCAAKGQRKPSQRTKASIRSAPVPADGWFPNWHNKSSKKRDGRVGNEGERVAEGQSLGVVRSVGNRVESSQCVHVGTNLASLAQRHRQTSQEAEPKSKETSPNSTLVVKGHEWMVKTALGMFKEAFNLFTENPSLAMEKDFISGYTVWHWIAKHGNRTALSAFFRAARKRKVALSMDVKSTCGYTPLHLAAIHGQVKVIQYLVKKSGANVGLRDHSGKKPWQYLSTETPPDVCQLLGAPMNEPITDAGRNRHQPSRAVSRKTSFTAFFKSPPILRKFSHFHSDHFSAVREEDEEDD
uniref:Uncharacterized protein n=1 Tax=Callorhinchus milii TaxID=7868 RepID=A0A4W3HNW7_CALMI